MSDIFNIVCGPCILSTWLSGGLYKGMSETVCKECSTLESTVR